MRLHGLFREVQGLVAEAEWFFFDRFAFQIHVDFLRIIISVPEVLLSNSRFQMF